MCSGIHQTLAGIGAGPVRLEEVARCDFAEHDWWWALLVDSLASDIVVAGTMDVAGVTDCMLCMLIVRSYVHLQVIIPLHEFYVP